MIIFILIFALVMAACPLALEHARMGDQSTVSKAMREFREWRQRRKTD